MTADELSAFSDGEEGFVAYDPEEGGDDYEDMLDPEGDRCAPFTCAWACEVPRFCPSHLIEVGDVVIRLARYWRVTAKEFTEYGFRINAIERNPARRSGPRTMRSFSTRWHVLRPGVCGARACERHVREVGDGVHHCRAHWRAWMEAA